MIFANCDRRSTVSSGDRIHWIVRERFEKHEDEHGNSVDLVWGFVYCMDKWEMVAFQKDDADITCKMCTKKMTEEIRKRLLS